MTRHFSHNVYFFLLPTLFVPRVPYSVPEIYFMYINWQDAGIRTRFAATAARCATNELHTSLSATHIPSELHMLPWWATHIPELYTHPCELHTSLWATHIPVSYTHPYELHTSLITYILLNIGHKKCLKGKWVDKGFHNEKRGLFTGMDRKSAYLPGWIGKFIFI